MSKKGENIYKRRDGRYEGRYVIGKKPNGKTAFGYIYAYKYAEVKKALAIAKVAQKQKNRQIIGDGTLCEYLKWWLENGVKPRVKRSTYSQYEERVQSRIIPELGAVTLRHLEAGHIQNFADGLATSGYARSTVSNIIGLLRTALKKAVELDLIGANPCARVKLPAPESSERMALGRSEQIQLEKAAVLAGRSVDIAVHLGLYTGLRIGEICALRWRDIDLCSGTLNVRGTLQRIRLFSGTDKTALIEGTPKSKRSRRCLPMPSDLTDKLCGYMQDAQPESFVLTGTLCALEPRTLRTKFSKAAKSADINVPFHALRHTYATRCLENNFDIQTLSELLGHSTPGTTMNIYAHSLLEHKRLLTNRLHLLSENV